jgi:hypothetical protein
MKSDGKQLESLVAYVEKTLLPEGFSVTPNERIFNDEGIQIAEFDIEIKGRIGSTEISWLIECRDRPSSGPAPGSWIEQLVGRRSRFGFNKVTAVSTTGFAAGAVEFALSEGIEIREVKSLDPEEFSDWLYITKIQQIARITTLEHATIFIDDEESPEKKKAFEAVLNSKNGDTKFLRSSSTNTMASPREAFSGAASSVGDVFEGLELNGEASSVRINAKYEEHDHFLVETPLGEVKITSINFDGKVSLTSTDIPLFSTSEYRNAGTKEVISKVTSFAPQSIQGMRFTTEFHKMNETGETHIVMRRLSDEA